MSILRKTQIFAISQRLLNEDIRRSSQWNNLRNSILVSCNGSVPEFYDPRVPEPAPVLSFGYGCGGFGFNQFISDLFTHSNFLQAYVKNVQSLNYILILILLNAPVFNGPNWSGSQSVYDSENVQIYCARLNYV